MKTLPINQKTIKQIIEEVKAFQKNELKTDKEVRTELSDYYVHNYINNLQDYGQIKATQYLVSLSVEFTMRLLELEKEERAFAV